MVGEGQFGLRRLRMVIVGLCVRVEDVVLDEVTFVGRCTPGSTGKLALERACRGQLQSVRVRPRRDNSGLVAGVCGFSERH